MLIVIIIVKTFGWKAYSSSYRPSFIKCINVEGWINNNLEINWKICHLSIEPLNIFQNAWLGKSLLVRSIESLRLINKELFEVFSTTNMWYNIEYCPFKIVQKLGASSLRFFVEFIHNANSQTPINLNNQAFDHKTSEAITN